MSTFLQNSSWRRRLTAHSRMKNRIIAARSDKFASSVKDAGQGCIEITLTQPPDLYLYVSVSSLVAVAVAQAF
uniref:Tubby C-terminal domain-containing protein n=1 Tax=Panagrellus redivivus TaxID=6233 RepID=A0A7E4VGQ9_PANRE